MSLYCTYCKYSRIFKLLPWRKPHLLLHGTPFWRMCQEVTSCTTGCFHSVKCTLGSIFVATVATKNFQWFPLTKYIVAAVATAAEIEIFLSQRRSSSLWYLSLLLLKSVFPYIATVAETRFSTTAAIVATGAIIWKPGLRGLKTDNHCRKVENVLHLGITLNTVDQILIYLKIKRNDIDGNRRRSRIVLKGSSQKSLRKEESWYPEDLQESKMKNSEQCFSSSFTRCKKIRFSLSWLCAAYAVVITINGQFNSNSVSKAT